MAASPCDVDLVNKVVTPGSFLKKTVSKMLLLSTCPDVYLIVPLYSLITATLAPQTRHMFTSDVNKQVD